ncbi:MAG: hypothetical protein K6F78_08905 [Bacteroidaceae bacterium]|nr:hypothetical protein [Bacteroidaceae bacterium]
MDEALDYIYFDSVYNSGGESSSGGSNDVQPQWAKIMVVITMIGIVAFIIYGWCEITK